MENILIHYRNIIIHRYKRKHFDLPWSGPCYCHTPQISFQDTFRSDFLRPGLLACEQTLGHSLSSQCWSLLRYCATAGGGYFTCASVFTVRALARWTGLHIASDMEAQSSSPFTNSDAAKEDRIWLHILTVLQTSMMGGKKSDPQLSRQINGLVTRKTPTMDLDSPWVFFQLFTQLLA